MNILKYFFFNIMFFGLEYNFPFVLPTMITFSCSSNLCLNYKRIKWALPARGHSIALQANYHGFKVDHLQIIYLLHGCSQSVSPIILLNVHLWGL